MPRRLRLALRLPFGLGVARVASAALVALPLSAVACASPPAPHTATQTTSANVDVPAPKESASAAADVDTLLLRESTVPLRDFRVRAGDSALELHVKSTALPQVKTKKNADGGAFTIATFSIGSDTEVVCSASSTNVDIAHWAESIVSAMNMQLSKPPSVAVETAAGRPVMFIETDGVLVDAADGKKKRNLAKFAGVHFDHGSVTCVHDGIGYRQTFRDLMLHIATKTQTPQADRPSFRQISVINDGTQVIGFNLHRAYPGEKKGETNESHVSSVILSSEGRWAAGDSGWSGVVDDKGVVSERSMQRVGAVTAHDIELKRRAPGLYSFEGTILGEAKKGTFKTKGPMVTTLSRASLLAAFARDEKKKELVLFHFEQDEPGAPVKDVVRHGGPGVLRLEENGKSYDCTIDASGFCTKMKRTDSTWFTQIVFTDGQR